MKHILSILICTFMWSTAIASPPPKTTVTVVEYPNKNSTSMHYIINFKDSFNSSSAKVTTEILTQANTDDSILIEIRSPGGSLKALVEILDAMQDTKAKVHCNIQGWAASTAAILAWNCPTLSADHGSLVLFHVPAITIEPLKTEKRLTPQVLDKYSQDLKNSNTFILSRYLKGAMSSKNLKSYNAGLDVVVPAKETIARHAALNGYKLRPTPQEDIDKATRPEKPRRLLTNRR